MSNEVLCISNDMNRVLQYIEEMYDEKIEGLEKGVKKQYRPNVRIDFEEGIKKLVEILREKKIGTLVIPASPCWDEFEIVELNTV